MSRADEILDRATRGIYRGRFKTPDDAKRMHSMVRERLRTRKKNGSIDVPISLSLPRGSTVLVVGPSHAVKGARSVEEPVPEAEEFEEIAPAGNMDGVENADNRESRASLWKLTAMGEQLRRSHPEVAALTIEQITEAMRQSRQELEGRGDA